jgi:hypothetical protein
MSDEFTSLFATESNGTVSTSAGMLAGTQQLTSIASSITNTIVSSAAADQEKYGKAVVASKSDMTSLDNLINELYDLKAVNVDFLKSIDEDTINGMLKSQQSKRSRCKSKEMTMDNYRSMMTAAVAENLIRLAFNKSKGSFGGRASDGVGYDEEAINKLAGDQEALRKEIRNIQSKKSIMKSKAGFSEEDERWQQLLVAEEQLKALRSVAPVVTKVVEDPLRDEMKEMLAELDQDSMTAKQLKELVASLKDHVFSDATTEEVNQ